MLRLVTAICFYLGSILSQPPYKHNHKHLSQQHSKFSQLGAVIYLVNPNKDFLDARPGRHCGLNNSLTMLGDKWLKHYPYSVILMNTRPWATNEIKLVRRYWNNLDIRFINIKPYFNIHSKSEVFEDHKDPLSDINYKRMCSFFFSGFLKVPLLQEYRYLMRLDDDTCILDHINFDLFHEMAVGNVYYAFQAIFCDPDFVVKGLREYVFNYTESTGLTVANPPLYELITNRGQICYDSFSTNLEVIDTWRYRQADIDHFLQNITDSNLIFHRRWGDAPLRMVIAQLFWGPDEVMRLCEFDYQHSDWEATDMCETRHTKDAVISLVT